ncbi:helix-turn-helix domain-containing protein [Aquimarina sp. 433]
MKYLFFFSTIFFLLCNYTAKAQDHFEELRELLRKETETSKRIKITEDLLDQYKGSSDTLKMANAYHFLSFLKPNDKSAFIDSIILITKNKRYSRYPAGAYLEKGNIKYELGDYIGALESYVQASEKAKTNGNDKLHADAKFNIGLLKNQAGDYEESKTIFAEYITFLEQNANYRTTFNYNPALFALADSYIHTKDLDLVEKIIDKGIEQTLKTNDSATYSYIIVTSGIHQYLLKNYKNAIDSLQKGKELIRKFDPVETRIATCDYYIGRSYKDLGNKETGLSYFKKVDTTLRKTKDVIPETIKVYEYLKEDAESKGDYKLQLDYLNTHLELDSIRHANQVYLTRNITRKYDAAELISEKEKLIAKYEKDTFLKNNTITFLIVLSLILVLLAIYGFRRSYLNKSRFQKLLLEQQEKSKINQSAALEKEITSNLTKKEDLDIPEDVIETILKKLQDFEAKNQFAKKHYTLNSLAKELNTNSAYLSKIINVYKSVNFSNYLNNLRIDFAVDQLSTNKALRSYTIQAIAEEVGFKNAQSFSSAFHKKTGIYPSYFIKHLKD